MNFAQWIQDKIDLLGVNNTEAAEKFGVSRMGLYRWLNSQRVPDVYALWGVCLAVHHQTEAFRSFDECLCSAVVSIVNTRGSRDS